MAVSQERRAVARTNRRSVSTALGLCRQASQRDALRKPQLRITIDKRICSKTRLRRK